MKLGCKLNHKSLFAENPGKIPENLGKFSENRAEKATNVVSFQKIAPNVCRKTHEGLFLEIIPKKVFTILCRIKFVGKSRTKTFRQF